MTQINCKLVIGSDHLETGRSMPTIEPDEVADDAEQVEQLDTARSGEGAPGGPNPDQAPKKDQNVWKPPSIEVPLPQAVLGQLQYAGFTTPQMSSFLDCEPVALDRKILSHNYPVSWTT